MFLSRSGINLSKTASDQDRALSESGSSGRVEEQHPHSESADPEALGNHYYQLLRIGAHKELMEAGGGHLLSESQRNVVNRSLSRAPRHDS